MNFKSNYFYNTVYDIDYDMLYKKKIKCIMFDLDNTLALIISSQSSSSSGYTLSTPKT